MPSNPCAYHRLVFRADRFLCVYCGAVWPTAAVKPSPEGHPRRHVPSGHASESLSSRVLGPTYRPSPGSPFA